MRLIQISLKHCEAALNLLSQTIYEKGIEAAIINEPYCNNKSVVRATDVTGKAVINQAIKEVMMMIPELVYIDIVVILHQVHR